MPRPLLPALLLSSALAFTDDSPVDEAETNTPAALVRRFLLAAHEQTDGASLGPDDGGWSAAFVHYVGYWSHYDYRLRRSAWPLPPTASSNALAAFANEHGVLSTQWTPEPGDIYLQWSPSRRLFRRAGIVLARIHSVRAGDEYRHECHTIDGDTNRAGALRGPHTAIVRRRLSSGRDALIRWALLGGSGNGTAIPGRAA